MRVDLFTMIHKAVRSLLFELAADAARIDLRSTSAIDALVARIEHAVDLLDEHAHQEDTHVFPAVRTIAPDLASSLAADHRALDVVAIEVERAALALAQVELAERPAGGAQLARLLNHLVALQLVHMGREETEVNAALWSGLDDTELAAVRDRILGGIPAARTEEWRNLMAPALSPMERQLVLGMTLG